ncbi:hypothetical protein [Leptospira noguchii]|uniref:hypothetical protein n=1 Tax=Leptospira noguchii TaxID=28182 RepID=UPI000C1FD17C|nr:hypothetical protein [Leptospira noguchii]UOG59496.1 hypothetical protein MAL07_11875 [Leptospira noguchii]UOG59982.1 hypothetical protein MAL07_14665 [Leptospira noguchii]UOG60017.1 hypothetical protein MAL07_14860 [Leptospira noguchii]UOG60144.1 hypothetical protein MAL07_15665 [Leptospira noguchii]UOG60156.1 hypothetical protein MAL07_15725 [Leptospira noguchii]
MFLEHKAVPSMIFLNRRSQEGRWQIDRSLGAFGPRSIDESKSATANSCVATKPSRPRIGVPVYQNSSLLRPSAPFVY